MLTIIGCIGVTGGAAAPLYSVRDRIYSSPVLFRIKLLAEQMAECAAQCATVTCAAETRGNHAHFGSVRGPWSHLHIKCLNGDCITLKARKVPVQSR